MAKETAQPLTIDEVLALPVSVDLVTAARCFGIGRTLAHELARAGEFPCNVLRLGAKYRVTRAELLRALGIPAEGKAPAHEGGDASPVTETAA